MTLSTTANKVSYAGDGATVSFAIPFLFLENGHVEAILRDAAGDETVWALNTQFMLTGAGAASGGTLMVSTNPTDYTPATGETLVIRRVVPETQETDYPEGGAFPAAAHEQALDKLTMLVQQHSEEIARGLKIPLTDEGIDTTLESVANRANKVLTFDADGDFSLLTPTDDSTNTATATGGNTARSHAERFAQLINIKDYGATGDGSTDDTVAITAWLAAIASTGITGYVPKGVYKDTLARVITTNISIVGEHPTKSIFAPASSITDPFYMTFVGASASLFNAETSVRKIGFYPNGITGLTGGVIRFVDALRVDVEDVIILPDSAASIEGVRFESDEGFCESWRIQRLTIRNVKDGVRFCSTTETISDRYRPVDGGGGSYLQGSARDVSINVNVDNGTGWILNGGFSRCTFENVGGWVEGDNSAMFEARTGDLSTALFLSPWVDPAATGIGSGMWRFRDESGADHYVKGGRIVAPSYGGRMTDVTAGTFLVMPHWGGVIDGGADRANDMYSSDNHILKSNDRWHTVREDFDSLDATRWATSGSVGLSTSRASTVDISPNSGFASMYSQAVAWSHDAIDAGYLAFKCRFRVDNLTNTIFVIGVSRDAQHEADITGARNSYLFTNEDPTSLGNPSARLSFVTVDTAGTAVAASVNMGTISVDTDYEVTLVISRTGAEAVVFLDAVFMGTVSLDTFIRHIKAGAINSVGSSTLSIDHITWTANRTP